MNTDLLPQHYLIFLKVIVPLSSIKFTIKNEHFFNTGCIEVPLLGPRLKSSYIPLNQLVLLM
jgi:hypothetical protein